MDLVMAPREKTPEMIFPQKKIKVLLVIPYLHQGGAERQVNYLAENLDRDRFEVHVAYFYNRDIFFKNLIRNPTAAHLLGSGKKMTLRTIWDFIRLNRELKPDILHLYTQRGNYVGGFSSLFFNVPVIIFSMRGANNRKYNHITYRILRGRQSLTIVNSEGIRRELLEKAGYREKDVMIIHNFLDTKKFIPGDAAQRLQAKEKLGFHPQDLVIASIGRISAEKNQWSTLHAVKWLRGKNLLPRGFRMILVGKCYDERYYRHTQIMMRELKLEDICSLHEPFHDVVPLYHGVDGVFQPSKYEGLSNVIIEAQACGTPVALSQEGDNDDLIGHEKTGISFSIEDEEQIAEGLAQLVRLCRDPKRREEITSLARRQVESRFSIEKEIRTYEETYLRLLGEIKKPLKVGKENFETAAWGDAKTKME